MKRFMDIDFDSGGIKARELLFSAGAPGKSSYYYYYSMKSKFEKIDEAIVDGENWHTVKTRRGSEAERWLRDQGCVVETDSSWAFCSFFDVPDDIYTMLILKFQ